MKNEIMKTCEQDKVSTLNMFASRRHVKYNTYSPAKGEKQPRRVCSRKERPQYRPLKKLDLGDPFVTLQQKFGMICHPPSGN